MKLGVLTNLFGDKPLSEVLPLFKELGIESLELGCGGYPGNAHCNPAVLLDSPSAREELKSLISGYGMDISALSVHGNPVHPIKETAKAYHDDIVSAILLAEKLSVDTIVTFSGTPGGCAEDKTPNWATCPWPGEYLDVINYQWNDVLIPYWTKMAGFAKDHGVTKIAFEMHPGFCVYNPETLLKLRAAVGEVIGANFDPSHLIWQGMDIPAAIRALRGAIYHFHAKDTKMDKYNTAKNGVLDLKHYTNVADRSWSFRTVGFGNGADYWRAIISELRLAGYDKVMSIEHEDSLMTPEEGLRHACRFLRESIIKDPSPNSISWA